MRKLNSAALALLGLGALGACSGGGSMLGSGPDPIAASRQVALVIPPDYGLTPPPAGTAGTVAAGNEAESLEAIFGGSSPRPYAERDVLNRAGRADMGIRSNAGDADTPTVNKGTATIDIIRSPEGGNPGVTTGVGG